MATDPNITVIDKDGNELADYDVKVNGILPGSGGGATEIDDLSDVDVTALFEGPLSERPSEGDAADNARYYARDQEIRYRNDPDNGWVVTGHGTQSDPVPEGHYQSVGTDALNNTQYVGTESELRDAGSLVDSDSTVHNIVLTADITLSNGEFHPPTNSANGKLWLNGYTLKLGNSVNENVVHIEGGDHWEIYGPGVIDGNKANQTDQADSSLQHNVRIRACQNPAVVGVEFVNSFANGLQVLNSPTDATVRNCEFHDCGSGNYTASNEHGGCDLLGGDRMTVTGCKFSNCHSHWAIVRGGSGARVNGCKLTDCSGDGVTDPNGPQSGFLMQFVNDAVMANCSGQGVQTASSGTADVCRAEDFYDSVMIGCTGTGAPDAGCRLGDDSHDSVMTGCVGNNCNDGLVIGGQSDGCTISGGRADGNTNGVSVLGGSDHLVTGCNLINNTTAINDSGTNTTTTANKTA